MRSIAVERRVLALHTLIGRVASCSPRPTKRSRCSRICIIHDQHVNASCMVAHTRIQGVKVVNHEPRIRAAPRIPCPPV